MEQKKLTRLALALTMLWLYKHHFYDNGIFYRVVPNFVAQFGTSDSLKIAKWQKHKVPDEPVVKGDGKGTLSFATDGKETRSTEMFINLQGRQTRTPNCIKIVHPPNAMTINILMPKPQDNGILLAAKNPTTRLTC